MVTTADVPEVAKPEERRKKEYSGGTLDSNMEMVYGWILTARTTNRQRPETYFERLSAAHIVNRRRPEMPR